MKRVAGRPRIERGDGIRRQRQLQFNAVNFGGGSPSTDPGEAHYNHQRTVTAVA